MFIGFRFVSINLTQIFNIGLVVYIHDCGRSKSILTPMSILSVNGNKSSAKDVNDQCTQLSLWLSIDVISCILVSIRIIQVHLDCFNAFLYPHPHKPQNKMNYRENTLTQKLIHLHLHFPVYRQEQVTVANNVTNMKVYSIFVCEIYLIEIFLYNRLCHRFQLVHFTETLMFS